MRCSPAVLHEGDLHDDHDDLTSTSIDNAPSQYQVPKLAFHSSHDVYMKKQKASKMVCNEQR